jgi:hypothetical protein
MEELKKVPPKYASYANCSGGVKNLGTSTNITH